MSGTLRHFAAACAFTVLAIAWSFPLVLHLSTHLPGEAVGDNVVFLWNFWWMRTAIASGANFFHTSYLFAPAGADLTLHTHTALPAFIGATILKPLPVVAALNLTILAALSLNGFCAYFLAWRITGDRGAAVVAGIIFGSSTYVAAHLMSGHFNLTMAWTIPLFALTVVEATRGSMKWGVLSGVVLGVTAYIDYYYVIYEIALALSVLGLAARRWPFTVRATNPYPTWLVVLVSVAIGFDLAAIALIMTTGGLVGQLGPMRVSMQEIFNPLQILWVLVWLAVWVRTRPRISAGPRDTWSAVRATQPLLAMLAIFLVIAAPLIWNAIGLLLRGEYVTQQYYWRSSPGGVDAATLLLGNPFQGIWGGVVRHLDARMDIDVFESVAWLGIAPLALSAYALRHKSNDPAVRQWIVVGTIFFIWALGSHLYVFGRNTGMILPEALLRFVPIASNARMPGRAMVVVSLAAAILAAIGLADYLTRCRRPTLGLWLIAIAVSADFLAAPFPIVRIECPAIYQILRDRPEPGAVVELPLGLGDGLGPVTPIDYGMFTCQLIHRRPLVGGFIARLPPNVLATYRADPLIAAWLRLSGARGGVVDDGPLPDSRLSDERLKTDGIAFVMLNRNTASAALREYVDRVMPLTLIAEDSGRALYLARR